MKNIIVIASCRSGHNFVAEQIRSWGSEGEYIIHNFEDVKPRDHDMMKEQFCTAGLIDDTLQTITVLVVRDLMNWWASYLKWILKSTISTHAKFDNDFLLLKEQTHAKFDHAFLLWKEQAEEAIQKTTFIASKAIVMYDAFKDMDSERKSLCNIVGGNYNESRLDLVPSPGRGSSFDKGIPGREMKTHLRYQELISGPMRELYCGGLKENPEAVELYKKYFFLSEEKEKIIINANI